MEVKCAHQISELHWNSHFFNLTLYIARDKVSLTWISAMTEQLTAHLGGKVSRSSILWATEVKHWAILQNMQNWPVLLNRRKYRVMTLPVKGSGIALVQTIPVMSECHFLFPSFSNIGLFDLFSFNAAAPTHFSCCQNGRLVRQHLSGTSRASLRKWAGSLWESLRKDQAQVCAKTVLKH